MNPDVQRRAPCDGRRCFRHSQYLVLTVPLTANQLRILEALQRLRIARTEGDVDAELVAYSRMDELLDREPRGIGSVSPIVP